MGAQEELDRLASALARAIPGATVGYAKMRVVGNTFIGTGGEVYVRVIVDKVGADGLDDDAKVVTTCCADQDAAVAELRAILRADTEAAVAEAYRKGAEAMREACAATCDRWAAVHDAKETMHAALGRVDEFGIDVAYQAATARAHWRDAATALRALPLPEVTP